MGREHSGGSGPAFFHGDHLGTTRQLTGPAGDGLLASPATYSPFGDPENAALSSLTSMAYTGQHRDSATDLQYHRARWLSTEKGRWLSEDPVFDFPANFGNRYGYVGNSPNHQMDAFGTFTYVELAVSGVIAGVLAGTGSFAAIRVYTNGKASLSYSLKFSIAVAIIAAILIPFIMAFSPTVAATAAASSQTAILGGVSTLKALVWSVLSPSLLKAIGGAFLATAILERLVVYFHFYSYYNAARLPTVQERRKINTAIRTVSGYNSIAGAKLNRMMRGGDIKIIDGNSDFWGIASPNDKIGLSGDMVANKGGASTEVLASVLYHEYFHTEQIDSVFLTGPFSAILFLVSEIEPYAEQFEFGKSLGLWTTASWSNTDFQIRDGVLKGQHKFGTIHSSDDIVLDHLARYPK